MNRIGVHRIALFTNHLTIDTYWGRAYSENIFALVWHVGSVFEGKQMQTRQARSDLTVYTMELERRTIPANAILHDFRVGQGHEGLAPYVTDVASFHYEGEVYFNMAHEIVGGTVVVKTA
jgi:hypothetical protein